MEAGGAQRRGGVAELQAQGTGRASSTRLSARLQGRRRRRQAARQSLCRTRALHRAAGAVRSLGRSVHPGRCRRRREPHRRRHDARDRQAALWRDLHRGVLRPYLPCHPGGLESGRARIRRRGGAQRLYPARLPEDAGARRAAVQDQRRIRQDRCRWRHRPLRRCRGRIARRSARGSSARCWPKRRQARRRAATPRWRNTPPT